MILVQLRIIEYPRNQVLIPISSDLDKINYMAECSEFDN